MRLFRRGSREERFWWWFQEHSEVLFRFETDQERIFDQVADSLHQVERGLTFEFGPVRDDKRDFVVSADGVRSLFPAVVGLVAAAPPMQRWTVISFRPPASIDLVVEYAGCQLGPDDIWFLADRDGDHIGLVLCVRGLTEENRPTLGNAGFLLLDNALGEFAVETQVGFIEWRPLPAHPEDNGLRPFRRIREVFDQVAQ